MYQYYIHELIDGGFSEKQARALVKVMIAMRDGLNPDDIDLDKPRVDHTIDESLSN